MYGGSKALLIKKMFLFCYSLEQTFEAAKDGRSSSKQASYQTVAILITLAISIASGVIAGQYECPISTEIKAVINYSNRLIDYSNRLVAVLALY